MKDFLGNELAIGDIVIFPQPRYRHLKRGKIVSFHKSKIKIEYKMWEENDYLITYLIEPEFNVIKDPLGKHETTNI
jgi:hypothetical protein